MSALDGLLNSCNCGKCGPCAARAELAALRKRCEALEKALEEIAKGATTAMEPPTSCGAACGNLDDAYSDGFARAIWSVGIEARKALRGDTL